ncbi:hypothetical protein ATO50_08240 [Aeromonas hydrophila]|nr:hypothetical protein ATO50_08240 [Aeromonas hydrophila]
MIDRSSASVVTTGGSLTIPPFWRFDKQASGEIGHLLTLAAQGIIRLNLLVKTPPFRKQKKLFKFSMFDHQTCIYRIGRMKTHSL